MGLAKNGYTDAKTGRVSEKILLNENGLIAQEGEAIGGQKNFSLTVNAENVLSTNRNVIDAFMVFVGGSTDNLTDKFSVTWEVN